MRKLLESFKKLVFEEQLADYDAGGTMPLYHYTNRTQEDELTLNPEYFLTHGSSYSMREREASRVPRVFFYPTTDPKKTERMVTGGSNLFSVDVPTSQVYDLKRDPEGFKEKIAHPTFGLRKGVEMTELLNAIRAQYGGAFYTQPSGIDMVIWFEPIAAKKIERDNNGN